MAENLVIIPTYNEKENIRDIVSVVRMLSPTFDILVVDDGSPDGTAAIVQEEMNKVPDRVFLLERSGKLGLGTAYIAGFKWALEKGYQYICEMDADFSHDPNDLIRLQAACEEGADLAIGSRYVTGVNVVNWPMGRVLMSYFASFYVRIITGMPFRDSTAGFKCYHRRIFDKVDLDKIPYGASPPEQLRPIEDKWLLRALAVRLDPVRSADVSQRVVLTLEQDDGMASQFILTVRKGVLDIQSHTGMQEGELDADLHIHMQREDFLLVAGANLSWADALAAKKLRMNSAEQFERFSSLFFAR